MGQKANPVGVRLGYIKDWESNWYAEGSAYRETLCADLKAREYIKRKLQQAAISSVQIERPAKNARIKIRAARPGSIIGKSGKDIEVLRDDVAKMLGVPVHISIEEVRRPGLDARLVAETIAQQLEKRVMFRRAMKRAVTGAMRLGAEGVKVCVAGRLGGAEIARTEWYREGRVPLHTLRADIDYATYEAHTTYGVIGVKVWIFKGEIIEKAAPKVDPTKSGEKETSEKGSKAQADEKEVAAKPKTTKKAAAKPKTTKKTAKPKTVKAEEADAEKKGAAIKESSESAEVAPATAGALEAEDEKKK